MTGDELERAIDFILKSQARAEARIERNEEQLSRLAEQLTRQGADFHTRHDAMDDAHANLVRVLTQYMQTQDRINESLRETDLRQARFSVSLAESLRAGEETLRVAMTKLATRQERTEATVDRLSNRVEALVKVVEEERNRGR